MFSQIAADALLAAWAENPLDAQCAAVLAGVAAKLPSLPPTLLPTIKSAMEHWQPDVTPEAQNAMAGDRGVQLTFLKERLHHAPRNLFWWHHLYEFARIHGDWSVLVAMLGEAMPPEGLASLFAFTMANGLLASGEARAAAGTYRECLHSLPLPVGEERLVTAWLRSGKIEKATELLRRCAEVRPWNAGLWLRLYELKTGGASRHTPLSGRTMVLGYSYNKADDLAETLDSLVKSDLGDAHVRILDNGSSDDTPDVIRRFVDRFGSERAEAVTMPVNVGAPAARNWLMNLPEVRKSDFVAYIDDDISLPQDWLLRLGAAVERYPDAGVWGCKVVNHDGPARVQCGEHNLTPDKQERKDILMSTIMLQDGDFGQADYIRPCTSVTGCVHLFRPDHLLENGPFDLRFSPTQYDDLERDLRMVLGGGYAVYQGFLSILHKRKTGSVSQAGQLEEGNTSANMYKLQTKYTVEEFERMASGMDRVLLDDLMGKMKALYG
ncbi:glycosyltransferase family A protein [uncultured Pseudodesulfovibrio sp.]|uniref:glycosyltransferase family A protein n=1 Tax=uncultured Pseudodesulfovibrio sp. TaxID=2035858 RepID=UPI0029C6B35D|nr:glycosyltransferase family A protein [uncultured Pseudodesulfovibrio sp.]